MSELKIRVVCFEEEKCQILFSGVFEVDDVVEKLYLVSILHRGSGADFTHVYDSKNNDRYTVYKDGAFSKPKEAID